MNGLELLDHGRRTFWMNCAIDGESLVPLAADRAAALMMSEEEFELPHALQSRLTKATSDNQLRKYANDLSPIRISLPGSANWSDYYKAAESILSCVQKRTTGDNTDLIEAKVAAYLLIGLARRKYSLPRVCFLCWRHARPGMKYCDEHICKDENRAKHQKAKRVIERLIQRWPVYDFFDRQETMILATCPEGDVLEDAIQYRVSKKPPKEYWRYIIRSCLQSMPYVMDRFSEDDSREIDRILSSTPKLDPREDLSEWEKLVDILRTSLKDKYCHSYNFDVWLDKIELANTWLEAECPTFKKIAKMKMQKLSGEKISRDLEITPSAVSKALERNKTCLNNSGFIPTRYISNAPQTAIARFRNGSMWRLPSATPRPSSPKSRILRKNIKHP